MWHDLAMVDIQILVITNDAANTESLRTLLPVIVKQAEVEFATTLDDSFGKLHVFHPDVILIDTGMGMAETSMLIGEARTVHPDARLVLLADALTWQEWRVRRANFGVLLKGFSLRQLSKAILPDPVAGET
jgi:CheY-like chemotaxis protein